jgi:hypothetical protein
MRIFLHRWHALPLVKLSGILEIARAAAVSPAACSPTARQTDRAIFPVLFLLAKHRIIQV